MMCISNTQLRSIIEREGPGLTDWRGRPIGAADLAMALDLRDARAIRALFPRALRVVAAVMERGARTHQGEDWRALPAGFHLTRARRHLDLLAGGDVSEPHLSHVACRLLMALERDAQVAPAGGGEVTCERSRK
jgi:Domain of unknown function (DUF5664)